MDNIKLENIKVLRRELMSLQERHIAFLCGDGEVPDTKLQKAFANILWEVDEETRRLVKLSTPRK